MRRSSSNTTEPNGTNAVLNVTATGKRKAGPAISPNNGSLTAPNVPNPTPAKISGEQNKMLAEMGIVSGMTQEQKNQRLEEWYRMQREKVAGDWRHPINFYGVVVDENTNGIAGASVGFLWNDVSGTSKSNTVSDADGLFYLIGVSGRVLNVNVEKPNYYYVKSLNENSFDYTSYVPNLNPVVFHLRKRGLGVDLVTSQYGVIRDLRVKAPLDGVPVNIDLLQRKVDGNGGLQIVQIKPIYEKWREAKQWSFRLAIPDGGFVEQNDEFPFEAPESGYQPAIEFVFRTGETNWMSEIRKDYYIKYGTPTKYGRLHLETSITMDGARLTYAINPDGTRYLEAK